MIDEDLAEENKPALTFPLMCEGSTISDWQVPVMFDRGS